MKKFLFFMIVLIFGFGMIWCASIFVTKPEAGKTYCVGGNLPIEWTKSGEMSDSVRITLRHANGTLAAVIIAPTENDGFYTWPIPYKFPTGDYKVFVKAKQGGPRGESGIFKIKICPIRPQDRIFVAYDPFWWIKDPAGPVGPPVDPLKGKLNISSLAGLHQSLKDPGEIALFKNGKLVAKLGSIGGNSRFVKLMDVSLSKENVAAISKGQGLFELRIMDLKGKLLHSQIIETKMQK